MPGISACTVSSLPLQIDAPWPISPSSREEELELALIRRERQLAVLLHANQELGLQRETAALLRIVLEAAAELLNATCGTAGVVEKDSLVISQELHDGTFHPLSRRFSSGEGSVGAVMASGEILAALVERDDLPAIGAQLCAPSFLVCVPICSAAGELLGCFEVYPLAPAPLSDADRSILLGLASMAAVALENGRILGERLEARQETASKSSLLSAAIESTMDGIMAVDAAGEITAVNGRFAEMWGIDEEMLAGGDSTQVLLSVLEEVRDPVSFFGLVTELYWHPERDSHDVVELKDGRCFERSSRPQLQGGRGVGRVWTFHDITELKKLEAQLLHAQKMEAVGTLAGGVAHDFNNLMTVINGYTSLLKTELDPPAPFNAFLGHISGACDRAVSLIRSLLAYSRREPARQTAMVECNSLVRKLTDFLTRLIGADIDIVTTLSREKLHVLADPRQLEQVLVNLCTNARDAMPDGGKISIAISEVAAAVGGDAAMRTIPHALITVSDNGQGMDESTCSRIFEPFFTTKPVGSGTGLGLSISYGLVKQHGGFITVKSARGVGTVFSIHLPLAMSDLPNGAVEGDHEIVASQDGKETILLVEDNAPVRALLSEVLSSRGYRVIEAVDGIDGVEKFTASSEEIDLVITDVVMPRRNGCEAFREMRSLRPGIPAVFISGYTCDSADRKVIFTEADGFLLKPIQPKRLLSRVREVLDRDPTAKVWMARTEGDF